MSDTQQAERQPRKIIPFKQQTCDECGYTWEPRLRATKDILQNNKGTRIFCPECRAINLCEKKQNYE